MARNNITVTEREINNYIIKVIVIIVINYINLSMKTIVQLCTLAKQETSILRSYNVTSLTDYEKAKG